jgi:hypothetical protein
VSLKRGPKPGKARRAIPQGTAPCGLGDLPADLVGPGRQFWLDAVAHLEATGRAQTVHRTALVVVCRLVDSLDADAGLNRLDCVRRWLHELGLTPTTSGRGATEAPTTDGPPQTGRARILSLIARKKKGA